MIPLVENQFHYRLFAQQFQDSMKRLLTQSYIHLMPLTYYGATVGRLLSGQEVDPFAWVLGIVMYLFIISALVLTAYLTWKHRDRKAFMIAVADSSVEKSREFHDAQLRLYEYFKARR